MTVGVEMRLGLSSVRGLVNRRRIAWLAILGVVVATSLAIMQPAQATPTLTVLNTEGFTGAATASSDWNRPSPASNTACLTAGTNTLQTPIPACSASAIDSAGSGTLRLTQNANGKVGTVYSTVSLPTAKGLDIKFDTYQYDATSIDPTTHVLTPADGIAFVLAATNPSNPSAPTTIGPVGGSLGYSATPSQAGVSYGYLGFGLDVYGNFNDSAFSGTGCPLTTRVTDSVTVRGPGNGLAGYCVVGTRHVADGDLDKELADSRPAPVPVEIAMNPSASPATTESGLDVPAGQWVIQVGTYTTGTQVVTGPLPKYTDSAYSNVAPSGWFDPVTGYPYQLTFGWAASTGNDNEYHEIDTLPTKTVTGQLPVYSLAATDNAGGQLIAGNQATVSVTPSLDDSEGSETQGATVTTTFPAGITPKSGSFSTNGYSCSTSGPIVTCNLAAGTYAPGDSLPTADIPVTVPGTTAAGNYAITAKVSSIDANPATTSHTVTVSKLTASASGAITYGANETLSIAVPSGATGSVAFTDASSNALCTIADVMLASSCNVTKPHGGSYAVTATYTPATGSPYASQTATTSFNVSKAAATFTATAVPASIAYGDQSTLAVSGLPSDATGSVTFRDAGSNVLCTISDITSEVSCDSPDTLDSAHYAVTATYSGDGNYNGNTAATAFDVTKATTSLSAARSDAAVVYGTTDTLSFSGLPSGATGTVTFRDGDDQVLCTATLPATSCATEVTLDVGGYDATATYSGNSNYAGSAATPVHFEVTKASPTLAASAASPAITYGDTDTLSYTGLPTGSIAATGTVTFAYGADHTVLCTATLPDTSCLTSAALGADSYDVTATYSGDDNYNSAIADPFTFSVGRHAADGLAAAAASASTSYGIAETLSFSGLLSDATGSVTFRDADDNVLCSVTLPDTSCSAPVGLRVAHYAVTATYSGDDNYSGADAPTSFDVTQAPTTLAAAVSSGSVAYGTGDTLSYSGLTLGGATAATGTVTFRDANGSLLCAATLPVTSCGTAAGLGVAHYAVTATYSGDGNHVGSSDTTSFDVTRVSTALVVAAAAQSTYGQETPLVAGGLQATGSAAATGTITFTDSDGTVLCVATLPQTGCDAAGKLGVGHHTITATYSGDANHSGSTATGGLDVARATFQLVVAVSHPSVVVGQTETITISGIPADATGSTTISSGGDTLCTIPQPGTSCDVSTGELGVAGRTITALVSAAQALPAGDYPVQAAYPGDTNYAPSSGTTEFTVTPVPHSTTTVDAGGPGKGSTTVTVKAPADATVSIVVKPSHGTAKLVDGKLVYKAARGFHGTDLVTYRVTMPDGSSRLVTVAFRVRKAGATGTHGAHPTKPAAGGGKSGGGGAVLPGTGSDLRVTWLAAGLGLVGLGGLLVVVARRREEKGGSSGA